MNTDIRVLLVSPCVADFAVLTALVERDGGKQITVRCAPDAQSFYDALYSAARFALIVVDDRLPGADWPGLVGVCARNRPTALTLLLSGEALDDAQQAQALAIGVNAIFPRNSAGLVALSRLASTLVVQASVFSLGGDGETLQSDDFAETDAEQERQRLVYAVSHDLQDPLQLARRYAQLLNQDFEQALGETGTKMLGNLQFNLNRTQEMLDELLDYSRLQSAKLNKEMVDFNQLIEEVFALYRLAMDEIGATVVSQDTLPTLFVDRWQFQRVLQNLVSNAIKFRSEKPLRIILRAQRVRDEWRLGIKDNGIGIAGSQVRRIFGMFERGDLADEFPGTGMGLAICKRIVQNHGGKIWVRSAPAEGSVFIFSVPQVEAVHDVASG